MRLELDEGAALAALGRNLSNPRRALTAAGALLLSRAQRAFRDQKSPEGTDWPPRRVPNVLGIIADLDAGRVPPQRRFEPGPALQDTGGLLRSLRFRLVAKDAVEVGSNLRRATKHNAGAPPDRVESYAVTERAKLALEKLLKRKGPWSQHRRELGFLLNKRTVNVRASVPSRPFLELGPKSMAALRPHLTAAILRSA